MEVRSLGPGGLGTGGLGTGGLGTGGLGTWRALHRPLVGILVPPDFPDIHLLAHFLGGANVVKIQLSG